jgi:succinate-semialdehyde dehydrogenase / glutarate-semialdehyde dehydrogenase
VAPIVAFDDELKRSPPPTQFRNASLDFVFTQDVDRALRVCEALESGMVGLNGGLVSNPAAPLGGVNQSGVGREGGGEGLDEYLATKYVGHRRLARQATRPRRSRH